MVGMVVIEARSHVDVGASGRTQTKRRKQLAVRWYCVSCEKSSKHEQDVVTLLCLQCGVSMDDGLLEAAAEQHGDSSRRRNRDGSSQARCGEEFRSS